MNKRQKKKLYKQETGKNPPKKMKYSGKSYHRAINKPWGGKKPTVNCSWDSEKLKEIATQFTKAWAGTRVTIEKAADALIKLFSGMGDVACNVVYALTSGLIVYFYTNVIGVWSCRFNE